jgi:hypothetical protein
MRSTTAKEVKLMWDGNRAFFGQLTCAGFLRNGALPEECPTGTEKKMRRRRKLEFKLLRESVLDLVKDCGGQT